MPAPGETDHPNVIMLPPLIVLIALVVAIVLEFTGILHFLPPISAASWAFYLGLVLIIASIALGAWAMRTFKAVGTNVSPRMPSLTLATDGPYRFTRNPIYLSFVLLLAGLCLLFSLDWGVILVPVLALVLHYGVVVREEAYLVDKFGQPYRDFLGRTRRWL